MTKRRSRWSLVAAFAVAALLLFLFRIEQQSLWLDEIMSLTVARRPLFEMLDFFRGLPEQHPLYYLLLHGWLELGDSEFVLRGFSVVFGVLTVPMLFGMVREVVDEVTAWIATGLLTFSPFWLFYAQEARMYTLLGFLTVVQTWLFLRWTATRGRWHAAAYVLTGVLGVYTHLFFLFVPLSHVVWHGVVSWKDPEEDVGVTLLPVAAVYTAYVPWAVFLLLHFPEGQGWKGMEHVLFGVPYSLFRFSAGYSELLANVGWKSRIGELLQANWLVLSLVGVGWGIPLLAGVRESLRVRRDSALLLAGLMVPIVASLILSVKTIVVGERYYVVGFPFYLALVALGLRALWKGGGKERAAGVVAAALVVAVSVNSLHGHFYNEGFGKEQWRSVAQQVAAEAEAGDVADFHRDYVENSFRYYYSRSPGPDLPTATRVDTSRLSAAPHLWLVVSHAAERSGCLEALRDAVELKASWRYPKASGIQLYVFEVSDAVASTSAPALRRILLDSCP